MTREEKEQTGKYVLKMARLLEDGCWQQKMLLNAVHIIDEVLEQELVLDKIRAEIEKAVWEDVVVRLDGTDEVRIPRLEPDDVFEIIDKYRGKSEETYI